jgi:hypothetical protein
MTPLQQLHALFDEVQKVRLGKPDHGTPPHRSDPKHAKRRMTIRRAWAASEAERRADVSACPRCRAWFPSFAERNHHRANACTKRPQP